MAKKLSDIEKHIHSCENDFYVYLESVLDKNAKDFLSRLVSLTQVYVFSGIIRNYFIGRKKDPLRDIDFIIQDDIDIPSLFPNLFLRKNSFGGYKITIGETAIDLWIIRNTWALKQGQLKLPFVLLDYLPNTTFFNFSSILYSLNNHKFTVGVHFLRFMRDNTLDVVFEKNPHPALCIVNTFYYSDKFNLRLSHKLASYVCNQYESNIEYFESAQTKHFGKVIYHKNDLINRIHNLEEKIETEKKTN